MRIMHEASLYDENAFITLTYSDEHLPHGDLPTLDRRDLQKFYKRARKARGPFRYFGAGEYGSQTQRPHYHVITFGWRPVRRSQVTASTYDSDELEKLWPLGECTVGDVTPASAAYVAQYCLKKQYGIEERVQGRAHEFCSMSKGIGRGWLDKWSGDLDRGYIVHNGRKTRIPRYYRLKKGESDPEWAASMEAKAEAFLAGLPSEERLDPRLSVRETVLVSKRSFFAGSREPDGVTQ